MDDERERTKVLIEEQEEANQKLMYRAAFGVCKVVTWEDKKIAIMAGGGNNGGDVEYYYEQYVSKG